tara:strand:+ start:1316 stop:2314 length:999 start_codon:yes stop_codon:yes gene_type:complete
MLTYNIGVNMMLKSVGKPEPYNKEGATWVCSLTLQTKNIQVNKSTQGGLNNPARMKLDFQKVSMLKDSFTETGQLDHLPKPIVEKLPTSVIGEDGEIKTHLLVDGHHRHMAADNSIKQLDCEEYTFGDENAKLDFQLWKNNHAVDTQSTVADLENALLMALKMGSFENTAEAMKEYLKGNSYHIHPSTRARAVKNAMKKAGTHVDFIEYDIKAIAQWNAKNGNYSIAGQLDAKRDKLGWSVKEGYEYEYIMNAIKSYRSSGKESYFLCHTKVPNKKYPDVHSRRDKMNKEVVSIEKALDEVFEFKLKNNRYPWQVEGFYPQDNTVEDPDKLY